MDTNKMETSQAVGSIDFEEWMRRERTVSERRQLGGLMLLLGTCAAIQPLFNVTSLVGNSGTSAETTIERASLAGGIGQVFFSSLSMLVGYLSMVHGYGDYRLSGILIVLTQLAWVPYISAMVDVGKSTSGPYNLGTRTITMEETIVLETFVENPFVPEEYLPTKRDVQLFGIFGIVAIVAYGLALVGSLAFTEFAIFAFDRGHVEARDTRYYASRLLFYSFVIVVAGMSQLLVGAYSLYEFGSGPLLPPITVALYQVHFPEISLSVGSLQMITGYYGVLRYLGWVRRGPGDHQFQYLLLLQWVAMLALQNLVQYGYGKGDEGAVAVHSSALFSVSMNIFPAFLDYKMRTLKDTRSIEPSEMVQLSRSDEAQALNRTLEVDEEVGSEKDSVPEILSVQEPEPDSSANHSASRMLASTELMEADDTDRSADAPTSNVLDSVPQVADTGETHGLSVVHTGEHLVDQSQDIVDNPFGPLHASSEKIPDENGEVVQDQQVNEISSSVPPPEVSEQVPGPDLSNNSDGVPQGETPGQEEVELGASHHSSVPDDSTAELQAKLDEIENEIFTDPIDEIA